MTATHTDTARFVHAGVRSGRFDADALAALRPETGDELVDGLRTQLEVLALWEAEGEQLGGWKIGLTSRGGRDSMGAGFRPFGYVLASRVLPTGARFDLGAVGHPWIEPEIAVRLGAPLVGAVSPDDARAAVSTVHPAFEILDRRVPAAAKRPFVRLADGLGQWGVVVGPGVAPDLALDALTVTLTCDGDSVDRGGSGPDVVDSPWVSLARVSACLAQHGRSLEAGQVVITGSLLDPVRLDGPGRWSADFAELGAVSLTAR